MFVTQKGDSLNRFFWRPFHQNLPVCGTFDSRVSTDRHVRREGIQWLSPVGILFGHSADQNMR